MSFLCRLCKWHVGDSLFVFGLIVVTLYSAHNFYLYLFPDTFGPIASAVEQMLAFLLHIVTQSDDASSGHTSSSDDSTVWPFLGSTIWSRSRSHARSHLNASGSNADPNSSSSNSSSVKKTDSLLHSLSPLTTEGPQKARSGKELQFHFSRLDSLEVFRWPLLLCSLLLFAMLIWSYVEALRTPPGEVPSVFRQRSKHSAALSMATFFEPLPLVPQSPRLSPLSPRRPSKGPLESISTTREGESRSGPEKAHFGLGRKRKKRDARKNHEESHLVMVEDNEKMSAFPSSSSRFPPALSGTRSAFPSIPPSIPASHIRVFSPPTFLSQADASQSQERNERIRRKRKSAQDSLRSPPLQHLGSDPPPLSRESTPIIMQGEKCSVAVVLGEENAERSGTRERGRTEKEDSSSDEETVEEFFFNPTVNAYTSVCNRFLNYCPSCASYKPPRAHHCSYCKRCVLRYDHHCPWIGQCVGFFNYKNFLLLLLYTWLMTTWVLFLLIGAYLAYWSEEKEFHAVTGKVLTDAQIDEWAAHDAMTIGRPFFGVYVCFLEALLFFVMSSKLLRRHIYLSSKNVSTIDALIYKYNEDQGWKLEGGRCGGEGRKGSAEESDDDPFSLAQQDAATDAEVSHRNKSELDGMERSQCSSPPSFGGSGLEHTTSLSCSNRGTSPPQTKGGLTEESGWRRRVRKHEYNLGLRRNLLHVFGDAACANRKSVPHTTYSSCHCYRSLLEGEEWEYTNFFVRWFWRLLPYPAFARQRVWEVRQPTAIARGGHSSSSFSYGSTSENAARSTIQEFSAGTALLASPEMRSMGMWSENVYLLMLEFVYSALLFILC